MIIARNIEDVYKKHKADLMKLIGQESKPITHAELVKRFIGEDGKQYYGFNPDMALPLERIGQLRFYMQLLAKGLTAEEDEAIDNEIERVLTDGLKNNKGAAQIGALIMERKKRRSMIIHTELFYNYLACQLIREDESPEYFDKDIQLQKVAQFKEEVKKKGSYNFFQVPEFTKLNGYLKLSESEWETYWQDSVLQQETLQEVLKVFSLWTLPTGKGKTSKIS